MASGLREFRKLREFRRVAGAGAYGGLRGFRADP